GTQGIVQGTYETFFAVANQHFNGEPNVRGDPTAVPGWRGPPRPPAPPVLLLEQRLRKEAERRPLIKVEEPW
ncbi:hypothetical protein, partial [Aeromonas media]|uniref:hypothetical protein n=1 Tax=Aeromonas media TaxID=651 RepID=UPI003D07BF98